MAETKTKETLISSPDMVNGFLAQNIVEVSVDDDFVWFTREGFALRWKLSEWQDVVDFVQLRSSRNKGEVDVRHRTDHRN